MMGKVHVYMCLHIATVNRTAGNKTKIFPNPFLFSTSWLLILAEAFRNDHVAACGSALRSTTEKNELCGYVTVPCSSKMTQRSSTVDWLKLWWRHQIGCDGTHTEQMFTFKVTLCNNSCTRYCIIVDVVNLELNYCIS